MSRFFMVHCVHMTEQAVHFLCRRLFAFWRHCCKDTPRLSSGRQRSVSHLERSRSCTDPR